MTGLVFVLDVTKMTRKVIVVNVVKITVLLMFSK